MITRSVSGIEIPALGFGTWKLSGPDCIAALRLALATGYRHIDTAQIYENEAEVGTALKESGVPRGDIFLTTKVWMTNLGARQMSASVEDSLRKLQTDYVDLLLIHWPSEDVPFAEQLQALAKLRDAGKARLIGVSNFPVALMREAVDNLGCPLACNQVEYHPYLSQKPVLDFTRTHDMLLTAYSPLARGKVAESKTLQEISARHGKSPGQVTLRWLLQQDGVAAIPKAASPGNIRANFDIFDFELSGDEMADIRALARPDGRMVHPAWAPVWDKSA